jgi:predicted RNA binding protein YcfA (HicA-like mRNA interferase family)
MPKLTPIPAREVLRKLRRLGYEGLFGGGKQAVMRNPETGVKISVPIHAARDLPLGTLRAIVKAAGVSIEE